METENGFIIGVHDYCDRWCERCPLTVRCRFFLDQGTGEFDLGHDVLTEPKAARQWRKVRASLTEAGAALDRQGRAVPDSRGWELPAHIRQSMQPDPDALATAQALRSKIERARTSGNSSTRHAVSTLGHFSVLVPMKMFRALSGAARGQDHRARADANGSAKAALLGLERMRGAWEALRETGFLSAADTAPFLAEIASMIDRLDRTVPGAHAFVRPGFDEPDAFMKLEAAERRRR